MRDLSIHTDQELLDLYLAATSLKSLHDKGGLEQHRLHYEQRANEYRQELLRRMQP